MRVDQQGRNDRAISLIAENIKKSLDHVEALGRQAEAQRLAFLAETENIQESASRMKAMMKGAVRRRDAGEEFEVADFDVLSIVQAPSDAHGSAPPRPEVSNDGSARLGVAKHRRLFCAADEDARSDLIPAAEKEACNKSYAMKVSQRSQLMKLRNSPIPRRRTIKNDAEELISVRDKNMAYEKAFKIRADLRMTLRDGVRVMHDRYMQKNEMELIIPRNKEQALKDQLVEVGYVMKNGYSPLDMQVRRKENGNKREKSNAYCAARAIERALKGNLKQSVNAYYVKILD